MRNAHTALDPVPAWSVPTLVDACGRDDAPASLVARAPDLAERVQDVLTAWGEAPDAPAPPLPTAACDCGRVVRVSALLDVRALPLALRTRDASHPIGVGVFEVLCEWCRQRLEVFGVTGWPGGTPVPRADILAALGAPAAVVARVAWKADTAARDAERRAEQVAE